MPIYEYQCESCQNCFEKLVFESDDPAVVCPCCGTPQVKKLVSAAGFIGGGCSPGAPSGFS